MATALVIGGTGFIGQHTVGEFSANGYDVAAVGRRDPPPRLAEDAMDYYRVDRRNSASLAEAVEEIAPEIVIDCALFHPADAREAIELFSDVEAYVYVSSGGVYVRDDIPKREGVTPLHDYREEDAGDDSMASYGPRKAECDRIVAESADRGVAAMCVRPTMVYGPSLVGVAGEEPAWAPDFPDIQNHHDYWIDRVNRYDRVLVPGDGTAIWHRVYVEDVARALRLVAEDGTPGSAYNVADRRVLTMAEVIELIADSLDTSVEIVTASRRELARFDLDPNDFVLYHHFTSEYPHVLATCKLARLGWRSTPVEGAMDRTVEESIASDRDGGAFDPGREREERAIDALAG